MKQRDDSGNEATENVALDVFPLPKSEFEQVSIVSKAPDRSGSRYLVVNTTAQPSKVWNTIEGPTREIRIAGLDVVLDKDHDTNGLFDLLDGKQDIETLTISAERLTIKTAVSVPSARVTIYAREIDFVDAPPALSSISTIPTSDPKEPDHDGNQGISGGPIELHIGSLVAPGNAPRFITRGATGQRARMGKDGAAGPSMPVAPRPFNWTYHIASGHANVNVSWQPLPGTPERKVVYVHGVSRDTGEVDIFGTKRWPDGDNAIPPTRPGPGGNGGALSATLTSCDALSDRRPGNSGSKAPDAHGGPPGQPTYALWMFIDNTRNPTKTTMEPHDTKGGNDAVAPDVDLTIPSAPGPFAKLDEPKRSWLRPEVVQLQLRWLSDLYLAGHLNEAEASCRSLAEVLSDAGELTLPSEESSNALAQALEYQNRILRNLDFFGHPATWVPALSLEVNKLIFEKEIEDAMETLYLAEWVSHHKQQREERIAGFDAGINQLGKEVEKAQASYEAAQSKFSELETQAKTIAVETELVLTAIAQRQTQLLAQAQVEFERSPIQKGASILATACTVIPVYQPVLGTIGKGIDLLASAGTKPYSEVIGESAELATEFSRSNFSESKKSLDEQLKLLKRSNAKERDTLAHDLGTIAREFSDAYKTFNKVTAERSVPADALQVALQQLEASDPPYADLVERCQKLAEERARFADEMQSVTQVITTCEAEIGRDLLAMRAMAAARSEDKAALDQSALSYVEDMRQAAAERLIRYQYYLAKAYAYRMLKPYTGSLDLEPIVRKVKSLCGPDQKNPILAKPDFDSLKIIYDASLKRMVSESLTELQEGSLKYGADVTIGLTQSELAALNKDGRVFVDLTSKMPPLEGEEDRRIASIALSSESRASLPGAAGSDTAYSKLTIKPIGDARLRKNGKFYRFDDKGNTIDRPFAWGGIFDLISRTNPIRPMTISNDTLSLIRVFVGLGSDFDETRVEPFSKPAAETHLLITKEDVPIGNAVHFDRLRMDVKISFFPSMTRDNLVRVSSSAALAPMITCEPNDLGGRGFGIGSFDRVYETDQPVILEAPAAVGTRKFLHWEDAAGKKVSDSPRYPFNVAGFTQLTAVFDGP